MLGALLLGCGPSVAVDDAAGGSTGHAETDGGSTNSTTMPGTTMPGTTMTSAGEVDVDDGVDDDESGVVDEDGLFVDPHDDVGDEPITDCSIWERDCPPGEKCMPYANDGGGSWNSTVCRPIEPEPNAVGDPCHAFESGTSGSDDCELHSMCWDLDLETLEGTCVSFCSGSADEPSCADPTTQCIIANDGVLALCLPSCHPLDAPCPTGVCTTLGEAFFCVPEDDGSVGPGEMCDWLGACEPGLYCLAPTSLLDCDPLALGCCSPFCDTTAEMPCAEGLGCLPWYDDGDAPEGFETLGVCAVQP